MASRYWVGGTANWDGTAGTKWALTSGGAGGQAVPTSADDVFFDANSGTNTVTISAGNTGAKSITCTGFTGTLAGSADISVAGSFVLVAGMTYTYSGILTLTATGTLTTAGKTLSNITFNGVGATFTLGSALTSNATITLTNGTFTTSGSNYAVTASTFDANNGNTKTITLNGSTITLNGNGWALSVATNTTLNAGTSTINISAGGNFLNSSQALTYNNVTFSSTSTVDVTISLDASTGTTFNTLTLNRPATANESIYSISGKGTISTLAFDASTAVRRILLLGTSKYTVGNQCALTVTSVSNFADIDFRDISFNTSRSGTRLGNCGGNTNITFDAAKTVYWNLAGTNGWGATGWATTSGGVPSINNYPLPQDTAVFNDTGAATQINLNSNWAIGNLNMSSRTNALTVNSTNDCYVFGSWTTGSGITYNGVNVLNFQNRSAATLTSAGKTFTQAFAFCPFGTTVTLQDALVTSNASANSAIFLGFGTFDTAGYNITCSGDPRGGIDVGITGNGGTASSATRTFALGSSTLTIASTSSTAFQNSGGSTGFTSTGSGVVKLTGATPKGFSGNGATYSFTVDQGGAGALTISGANTLGGISNTYSATGATTITFAANQTVSDFTATGTSGKVLTINSSVNGTQRTLTKTGGGVISVDYMSIRDSNAAGSGATWYAGANSTNVSNNTGWIFTAAPASGFFLLMPM